MASPLDEYTNKGPASPLDEYAYHMPEWQRRFLTMVPDATIGLIQDIGERLSSFTGQSLATLAKLSVPQAAQQLIDSPDPELQSAGHALMSQATGRTLPMGALPSPARGPVGVSELTAPLRGLLFKEPPPGTQPYSATADVLRQLGFEEPIAGQLGVKEPPAGVPNFVGLPGQIPFPVGAPARAARALTGPEAAGFALESLAAEGLTKAAASTIVPAGRAIGSSRAGEAARQLPVVRSVGRALSRGFDIPQTLPEVAGKAREGLRDILTRTSNEAAAVDYMLTQVVKDYRPRLEAAAKARGIKVDDMMRIVRDAAEELPRQGDAALRGLSAEEQALALAAREVSDTIPKLRGEAGLVEAPLGAGARAAAAGVRAAVGKAREAAAAEASLKAMASPELPGEAISGQRGVLPPPAGVREARPTGIAVESELAGPRLAAREELQGLREDLAAVNRHAAEEPNAPPLRPSEAKSILERRSRELEQELALAAERLREHEMPAFTQTTGLSPEATFVGAEPAAEGIATPPTSVLETARRQTKKALSEAYAAARRLEAEGVPLPRVAGPKGSFFGADLPPEGGIPLIGRRIDLEQAAKTAENIDRYLVGHTPWVRTAETRVAEGLKRYGTEPPPVTAGGPRGLGTRFGRARRTAPVKTLSELEAETGKRPYVSLEEAIPAHIRTNARAIANAKALQEVADFAGVRVSAKDATRFGAQIPEGETLGGYRSLGSITNAKAGLKPEVGAILDRTYVHPAVFSAMEDYASAMSPQNFGRTAAIAKAMLRGFKLLYTLPNPSFVLRNQEWNAVVSIMRGNRNPRTAAIAARILGQEAPDAAFSIGALKSTNGALMRDAVEDGIVTDLDLVRGELGTVGKSVTEKAENFGQKAAAWAQEPWKRYIAAMSSANWAGENWARMMHYVWARSAGMTRKEAATEVIRTYFNYSRDAYTAAENFGRNMVPWLSWLRNITRLTARTAFERPGEFARLGAGVNEWNAGQGVSPEEMAFLGPWYLSSLGLVLPPARDQPPGTRRMANLGFVGFLDPLQRFAPNTSDYEGKDAPTNRAIRLGLSLVSQLRPEVTTGAQEIFSRDLFTGGQLTGRPVRLPLYAAHFPAPVQRLLGIEVVDGVPIGSDRLKIALGAAGPLGSGPFGFLSDNPQDFARGVAWATSVKVDPIVNEALGRQFAYSAPAKGQKAEHQQLGQRARLIGRIHSQTKPASPLDYLMGQPDTTQGPP